jgi:predicted nucleic acid-binding protein
MTVDLDTSSLVKLYIAEPGSEDVREFVRQATVLSTSLLAYAETRAALARLRRDGALTASKFSLAKREFEKEWPAYFAVEVTDVLCRAAGGMAERYRLRGVDSLHLSRRRAVAQSAISNLQSAIPCLSS